MKGSNSTTLLKLIPLCSSQTAIFQGACVHSLPALMLRKAKNRKRRRTHPRKGQGQVWALGKRVLKRSKTRIVLGDNNERTGRSKGCDWFLCWQCYRWGYGVGAQVLWRSRSLWVTVISFQKKLTWWLRVRKGKISDVCDGSNKIEIVVQICLSIYVFTEQRSQHLVHK